MNNDEAMAEWLQSARPSTRRINGLNLYVQQSDNWLAAYKSSHMVSVKANATTAGADIEAWDGTPAPVEEVPA